MLTIKRFIILLFSAFVFLMLVFKIPDSKVIDEYNHTAFFRNAPPAIGLEGQFIDEGMLVTFIFPGSPAHIAGLQPYDIVTHIDGKPIEAKGTMLEGYFAGDEVTLAISRNGMILESPIELAAEQAIDSELYERWINNDVIKITNDNSEVHIRNIFELNRIDDRKPERNGFLIVEVAILNHKDESRKYYSGDFTAKIEGQQLSPSPDAMKGFREWIGGDWEYPGTHYITDRHGGLEVAAHAEKTTWLVYDIPENIATFEMTFLDENTFADLYLLRIAHTAAYLFVPQSAVKVVGWHINEDEVIESFVDMETLTADNCYGTGSIWKTRNLSRTTSTQIAIGTARDMELNIPVLKIIEVEGTLAYWREVTGIEEFTEDQQDSIEIIAGTRVSYEVAWYTVSIEGEVEIMVDDETHFIPFTSSNRLRGEIRSIETPDCD